MCAGYARGQNPGHPIPLRSTRRPSEYCLRPATFEECPGRRSSGPEPGEGGGMSKTYRDWSPDQAYLFPPSPKDWLPEDDLVYFLLDTVAALDLSSFTDHYQRELRGQPPYHPRMMVTLLLYCYATGT